jgi:multiple sugar transport system substrate-binding protein
MPGINGRSKATMGVADWMMGFRQNGHAEQIGDFLDFVYSEKNVLDFSREYSLLPVTTSASETMAGSKEDADLDQFLDELPNSELYPFGKTSWASVSADIKEQIGKAVGPKGNPGAVLGNLQRAAVSADNSA